MAPILVLHLEKNIYIFLFLISLFYIFYSR
ncbi:unnamed protein product [Larinioides sclopetarius]|uniref:Uncharacterized protein n=1 Tax=Larinioides sclopetarius TaxID=280406 RepID=A0AAV1Z5L6_9ARAC